MFFETLQTDQLEMIANILQILLYITPSRDQLHQTAYSFITIGYCRRVGEAFYTRSHGDGVSGCCRRWPVRGNQFGRSAARRRLPHLADGTTYRYLPTRWAHIFYTKLVRNVKLTKSSNLDIGKGYLNNIRSNSYAHGRLISSTKQN